MPVQVMNAIVVRVEWDVNRLNPNFISRLHWGAITTRKNGARYAAKVAWLQAGRPRVEVPVDVEVVVRRGRALDDDNAWAALKWVRDVLFKDAITVDDSPRWVRYLPLRYETGKRWVGREEVVFIVRARG